MRKLLLCFTLLFLFHFSKAGKISGTVTDDKGNPLPYASITIKGTTKGTNANSTGQYSLTLAPGEYTLVCQYVNYSKQEKTVRVQAGNLEVNFSLQVQELTLGEVIVKRGEDPAYEIIRQAIKKRSQYNNDVDSFEVNVYIKGLMRSRGLPTKVMGKAIERDENDGLDSLGRGIIFLSESLTKVSYKKPDKIKYNVISSRQSGGGFGLSFPFFVNFYQNNVSVFDNTFNPRGFISPIADGAIGFYKFKYEGSFVEEGKMINTITVIPRRKNEPLFSGTIQIVEDDWRIHSLDLRVVRAQSLELLDTLRINQIHSPIDKDIWKTKQQVMYLTMKTFGFDITGNFVNVYDEYDLTPGFSKKHFNRVVMKYDTAFNKKDSIYWEKARPVALENDEKRDYEFRDSLAKVERDSFYTRRNIDSLRKKQKPISLKDLVWSGVNHNFYGKKRTVQYSMKPLIPQLEYNTVEGLAISAEQTFVIRPAKSKLEYHLNWDTRYGTSNSHLNSFGELKIQPRTRNLLQPDYFRIAGGKRLSQFNHDNPIDPLTNAIFTLFWRKNFMKLYENWFGTIEYNTRTESGFGINIQSTFEDRIPVDNFTDFSFINKSKRGFLPNHPYELAHIPFEKHKALNIGATVTFQPGQRYIEFPDRKISLGSKYPVLELQYTKGIPNILNSVVDYDKWKFTVSDNLNLKLGGEFRYRAAIGGFINSKNVQIPDLQHFNGNQVYTNRKYLNSFMLAPYYRYSNSESFYSLLHIEHHFNGMITNKIPLFNRLKWNLVVGTNAFYVNNDNYYVEAFAGIENIFKIFRIDFVNAYQPGSDYKFGIKIGAGGLIGGRVQFVR